MLLLPFAFIEPAGAFPDWTSAAFTAAEQGNPAIGGPAADSDGDGVSNALEFAFGTAPKSPTL